MTQGPIDVVQNRLSVTVKPDGYAGHAALLRGGMGFASWHTLPSGRLVGREPVDGSAMVAAVRRISEAKGSSPEVVALAWLLGLSPQMLVIPGAVGPESIRDIRCWRLRRTLDPARDASSCRAGRERHSHGASHSGRGDPNARGGAGKGHGARTQGSALRSWIHGPIPSPSIGWTAPCGARFPSLSRRRRHPRHGTSRARNWKTAGTNRSSAPLSMMEHGRLIPCRVPCPYGAPTGR